MSDAPPSYDKAISQPSGRGGGLSAGGPEISRQRSNASTASSLSSSERDALAPGMTEDGRRSMDDEQRSLPEGWVRCFDPKQEHHFYVDTRSPNKRAIWVHPYDDPEYLASLPDTHPANPNSREGRAVAKAAAEEEAAVKAAESARAGAKGEKRNWLQRKKDAVIGTKEERAAAKAEKKKRQRDEIQRSIMAQQEYIKRRNELLQGQQAVLNDPSIRSRYASNPYAYAAPMGAFSRPYGMGMGGMGYSPYGYGYPGGYGRRYGGGMGMGLPLMGGLGGGLLLGSALGGGFGGGYGGYGGDCGGGDMGGGGDGGGGGE